MRLLCGPVDAHGEAKERERQGRSTINQLELGPVHEHRSGKELHRGLSCKKLEQVTHEQPQRVVRSKTWLQSSHA